MKKKHKTGLVLRAQRSAAPPRGKRAGKIGKTLDKERKNAYYNKVNKYSSGR